MRLDAHQHFWNYDKNRHGWISDDMNVIRRNFSPGDLIPLLDEAKIEGCVAVQADETLRETEYLLDLAAQYPQLKAVVGWADLAGDRLDETLDRFSDQAKLKGYREVLQSKDPEYMLRKDFIRGMKKLGKRGYTYDILIFPTHFEAALKLVKACPGQRFVIDHLAKPYIQQGEWKEWKKKMLLLAEHEMVCCKLSGLITEADWKNWKPEDLRPFLDIALELFRPDRLMYGSDWPVCLVAGQYEQVVEVIEQFTASLTTGEAEAIMGNTAADFYSITS